MRSFLWNTWLQITNQTSTFSCFPWILQVQFLEIYNYINKATLLIFHWNKYTSNKILLHYLLNDFLNSCLIFSCCFSHASINCSDCKCKQFPDLVAHAFVGLHHHPCTLYHAYFLSVKPFNQLPRQLGHKGFV